MGTKLCESISPTTRGRRLLHQMHRVALPARDKMLRPGFPKRAVWALGAALFVVLFVVLRQAPSALPVSSRRRGNSPSALLDDIGNATLGVGLLVIGVVTRRR